MEYVEIDLIVWKLTQKEEKLLKLIVKNLNSQLSEHDIKIASSTIDLSTSTYCLEPWVNKLVFGNIALKNMDAENEDYILMPPLEKLFKHKDNIENIQTGKEKISEFIKVILASQTKKEKEEEKKSYIELSDGTTVGLIGTDIILTEEEAETLKKIRDLFGDGKMVLEKGDLKITVDIKNA